MDKKRIYLLNFFSFFALLAIVFFSWQYLKIESEFQSSDYVLLSHTLSGHGQIYQNYYARYINMPLNAAPMLAINLNTPTMNLILKSLYGTTPYLSVNILLWTLLSLLLSAVSVSILMRYYSDSAMAEYYFLPMLLLFWLSWVCLYIQINGEVSFIVLPFLCAAFLLGHLKKWREMAAVLGLVASLKIFFLTGLLGFVLTREWKAASIFLVSFLFFLFLPLLDFSWPVYVAFFQSFHHQQYFFTNSGFSMNGALLAAVLSTLYFFHKPIMQMPLQVIVGTLSCYLIYRLCVYYYRYLRHINAYVYELGFSFLIILSLILSPLAWVYYYIFLVIPVVTVLKINRDYQMSTLFYILFACGLGLPILSWLHPGNLCLLVIRQFSAFVDLIVWMFCLHAASRGIVEDNRKATSSPTTAFSIIAGASLLSVVLLLNNYAFPQYFTIDKTVYKKENVPAIWLN